MKKLPYTPHTGRIFVNNGGGIGGQTRQIDNKISDVRPAAPRPPAYGLADFIVLLTYAPGKARYAVYAFPEFTQVGDHFPIEHAFYEVIEKL